MALASGNLSIDSPKNWVTRRWLVVLSASIFCILSGCATSEWERWKPFDEAKSAGDYTKALAIAKSERDRFPIPDSIEKVTSENWDDVVAHYNATNKMIEAYLGDSWRPGNNSDCAAVTVEYRSAINDFSRVSNYYSDQTTLNYIFRYKAGEIAQCLYKVGDPDRLKLITWAYMSTIQPGKSSNYQYKDKTEASKPLIDALKDAGDVKGARQVAAYEAVIRPKQAKMFDDFATAVNAQFKGVNDFWGRESVMFAGNANIYSQVGEGLKRAGYTLYLIPYEQSAGKDRWWSDNYQKRAEKERQNQASTDAWNSALLSLATQINASNVAQPVRAGAAGQWQSMSNNLNTIMLQSMTAQQNQVAASRTQAPVADLIRDALKDYEAANR